MIIQIDEIGESGRIYEGEEPAEVLGLDGTLGLWPSGPVRYSLQATLAGPGLHVRGSLSCDIRCECARCAEDFILGVRESSFERVFDQVKENESVDLTGDMCESIILRFPTVPVCDPGCKGLCPKCGMNLNRKRCKCNRSGPADVRWSALQDLKIG